MPELSTEEKERKEIIEQVKRAAVHLREITGVDSVQIMVTKTSDHGSNDTFAHDFGIGNIYARQGQVREWMIFMEQFEKQEAKRRDKRDHE